MSFGSDWGVGWGGANQSSGGTLLDVVVEDTLSILDAPVSMLFSVEVQDTISVTTFIQTGSVAVIPSFKVGVLNHLLIEVIFSTEMAVDPNFTNLANYTLHGLGGTIPVVTITPKSNTRALLELGIELVPAETYFLNLASSIVSIDSFTLTPDFAKFQCPNTHVQALEIAIRDFSGEVRGGLLGNPDGQIFFSPAYYSVGAISTLEVEEVSVCTRAYDEYFLPAPPDPQPLFTYGTGVTSVVGSTSVIWAPAERLGQARLDLKSLEKEWPSLPQDYAKPATLVETIDITRASFTNDTRWKTSPGTLVFKTADNMTSIGPGPTTTVRIDYPKIALVDNFPVVDQVAVAVL